MFLSFFSKPGYKVKKYHNGIDMTMLTKDGDIPFGWATATMEITEKIEAEYQNVCDEYFRNKYNSHPQKHIESLKKFLDYLHAERTRCYSTNECFSLWFDKRIESKENIESLEAELNDLESNYQRYVDEFEFFQKAKQSVIEKLVSCNGILATDFYKLFDSTRRHEIEAGIFYLVGEGKIRKEKSGRTNKLFIVEEGECHDS